MDKTNLAFSNCTTHNNQKSQFYDYDKNENRCAKCITELNPDNSKLILIEELVGDQEYIDNWPIFDKAEGSKLYDTIKKIESNKIASETEQKITNYFHQLKNKINEALDKSQKQIIARIQKIEAQRNQTVSTFKCKEQTDQLRKLWSSSLKDKNESAKLKSFIDKRKSDQQGLIELIKSQINTFKSTISEIDYKIIEKQQTNLLDLIAELNIFSTKKNESQTSSQNPAKPIESKKASEVNLSKMLNSQETDYTSQLSSRSSHSKSLHENILQQSLNTSFRNAPNIPNQNLQEIPEIIQQPYLQDANDYRVITPSRSQQQLKQQQNSNNQLQQMNSQYQRASQQLQNGQLYYQQQMNNNNQQKKQ